MWRNIPDIRYGANLDYNRQAHVSAADERRSVAPNGPFIVARLRALANGLFARSARVERILRAANSK